MNRDGLLKMSELADASGVALLGSGFIDVDTACALLGVVLPRLEGTAVLDALATAYVTEDPERIRDLSATVVLTVTSDTDDEIHAHLGDGNDYTLQAPAGDTVTGQFTVESSGSFEVESHESGKIIVILIVR